MVLNPTKDCAIARDTHFFFFVLHTTSWLAIIIVLLAFTYVQFQPRCWAEDFRTFFSVYYGWPLYAVKATEHVSPRHWSYEARLVGVLIDGFLLIVLLASTAFVV